MKVAVTVCPIIEGRLIVGRSIIFLVRRLCLPCLRSWCSGSGSLGSPARTALSGKGSPYTLLKAFTCNVKASFTQPVIQGSLHTLTHTLLGSSFTLSGLLFLDLEKGSINPGTLMYIITLLILKINGSNFSNSSWLKIAQFLPKVYLFP